MTIDTLDAIRQLGRDARSINRQLGSRATNPIEKWHVVGAPGEPSFTPYASGLTGHAPFAFFKDETNMVHLRGALQLATSAVYPYIDRVIVDVFTLPINYRPEAGEIFMRGSGRPNYAYISPGTGVLSIYTAYYYNPKAYLDGIFWKTP